VFEAIEDIFGTDPFLFVSPEAGTSVFEGLTGFLQGLGKVASDSHYFADGFHLQTEFGIGAVKLVKVPARHFDDDVVECGFEKRAGGTRDLVFEFVERIADSQFGSDFCDGIAGGLAGKGGGARYTRVDFDGDELFGLRVNGKLDIATAGKFAQGAHQSDGVVAHALVDGIGQGHCRCDGDAIARMDAHRVHVFNYADDDDIVVLIAQQF